MSFLSSQKPYWLLACLFLTLNLQAGRDTEALVNEIMEVSDSLVKARLAAFDDSMVEHRNDKVVRRRIRNYIEHWPIATGRLIARSARYFPIFEEQLAAAGMPLELKYVSIQESALRPYAISWAGAAGLWQLMPGTARELGLTVNETIDQRLDPELGCAAGLTYLGYQYERYQDWSLAIAAYNCGPGNVNKAIRRSGRKDPTYWQIRKHLPRETADYLPSIIAAIYIMTYYHDHDIAMAKMELDMQITESMTIYRDLSLHRVAQVTGLRPENIVELNPQYLKGYIPNTFRGLPLRLPSRVAPAMRSYLATYAEDRPEHTFHLPWASPRLHEGELNSDLYYAQYQTIASSQDTSLRQLANANQVPVDQLAAWSNRGALDSLHEMDRVVFYRVAEYQPLDPRDRNTPEAAAAITNHPVAPVITRLRPRAVPVEARVVPVAAEKKKPSLTERFKSWFE